MSRGKPHRIDCHCTLVEYLLICPIRKMAWFIYIMNTKNFESWISQKRHYEPQKNLKRVQLQLNQSFRKNWNDFWKSVLSGWKIGLKLAIFRHRLWELPHFAAKVIILIWKSIFSRSKNRWKTFRILARLGDMTVLVKSEKNRFWPLTASDGLGGQIWGHPVPLNRGRWATFELCHDLEKCFLLWFLGTRNSTY